jgi:hypothetical protein
MSLYASSECEVFAQAEVPVRVLACARSLRLVTVAWRSWRVLCSFFAQLASTMCFSSAFSYSYTLIDANASRQNDVC